MNSSKDWMRRHVEALEMPVAPFETAVILMLQAWNLYAMGHRDRYGCLIGDDGVLGREWAGIGRSLLGLLNGESGRLDRGSLDRWIRRTLLENGVECAEE